MLGIVLRLNRRAEGWLARVLHDVAALVEQAAADGAPPSPDVLAARLREQLDRDPTRDELIVLLSLVDGLASALMLTEAATVRSLLASYADGLRRDAGLQYLGER